MTAILATLPETVEVLARPPRNGAPVLEVHRPAQVIVDKQGQVRYAHYGHAMSDIPKVRELLALLDQLNA